MINPQNLHLFITEELCLVKEATEPEVAPDMTVSKVTKPETPTSEKKNTVIVQNVFIHHSENQEELDLLTKIVTACKLDPASYQLLKKQEENIKFEKAIIFSPSASQYYSVIEDEKSTIIYSRPLSILMSSKEEKGALWNALKTFF